MAEVKQTQKPPSAEDKIDRLRTYLTERVKEEGEMFVKSKFITDDVGLSAKEIGSLMLQLQDEGNALEIEKWGYSSATTWRITGS